MVGVSLTDDIDNTFAEHRVQLSSLTVGDMLSIVTSHEIREAVTDQQLNAWYDQVGYEADDKCAWHNLYKMGGTFWVQPEYSNINNGCVVPGAGPKALHTTTKH